MVVIRPNKTSVVFTHDITIMLVIHPLIHPNTYTFFLCLRPNIIATIASLRHSTTPCHPYLMVCANNLLLCSSFLRHSYIHTDRDCFTHCHAIHPHPQNSRPMALLLLRILWKRGGTWLEEIATSHCPFKKGRLIYFGTNQCCCSFVAFAHCDGCRELAQRGEPCKNNRQKVIEKR
mgnify:CR=1 FL=1